MLLKLSEWLEKLHWKWYWFGRKEPKELKRSEEYSRKMKELLLEDLRTIRIKEI